MKISISVFSRENSLGFGAAVFTFLMPVIAITAQERLHFAKSLPAVEIAVLSQVVCSVS